MNANSLNNYFDVLEEAGKRADFIDKNAKPQPYQPQTISIEDFRKRQENQRVQRQYEALGQYEAIANEALGENFFDPDFGLDKEYELASDRPLNPDPEPQPQPQQLPPGYGYFEYEGKRHENTGNGWNVLQPGQAAQDANIEREYQEKLKNKRKPGFVTGKPLLPSKLFQKPTIAQR